MAIAIIMLRGSIFNFFAKDNAIGAMIRTVATFSMNIERIPVSAHRARMAQAIVLVRLTIDSAIQAGGLVVHAAQQGGQENIGDE